MIHTLSRQPKHATARRVPCRISCEIALVSARSRWRSTIVAVGIDESCAHVVPCEATASVTAVARIGGCVLSLADQPAFSRISW